MVWDNSVVVVEWLSPTGLVLDLFGFWIIVWDVLPRYRLDVQRRDISWAMSIVERLKAKTEYQESEVDELKKLVRFFQDSGIDYRHWSGLHSRTHQKRKPLSAQGWGVIEAQMHIYANKIDEDIERCMNFPVRPPITLGVILVTFGFLLQLLGSIFTK